jgi:tetratricopeptide (TPR) repeat protein
MLITPARIFVRRVWAHIMGANVHYNKGRRLFHQGKFDEAIVEFERVLRIDPMNQWALVALGIVCEEKKDFARALDHYDRALEISPNFAQALFGRAETLQVLRRIPEAIDTYRAFLQHTDPSDAKQIALAEERIAKLEAR